MDFCTLDCIQLNGNFTATETCAFVSNQCSQSNIDFIQAYYCIANQSFLLTFFCGALLLSLIYISLQQITQDYLAPCVEEFIDRLKISKALAGITFLAFANGSADVITAVVAGNSDSSATALIPFGSIFGAGLLSMAFILGAVVWFSPGKTVQLSRDQTIYPLCFYIAGTFFLMLVSVIYGQMNVYLSLVLILLYIVYIISVLLREKKKVSQAVSSESLLSQIPDDTFEQNQKTGGTKEAIEHIQFDENQSFLSKLKIGMKVLFKHLLIPYSESSWEPTSALTSLILSPFVLALSQGNLFNTFVGNVPLLALLSIPAALLLAHSIFCLVKMKKPSGKIILFYTTYSFIIIVSWVALLTAVLINIIELFQLLTNINSVFLGLTLFAGINCIPDYLSITAFAKKGFAVTSISAIFSGQLFNFLIGFGASLLTQSWDGEYEFVLLDIKGTVFEVISSSIILFVIGMSFIYMILLLIRIITTKGCFQIRQSKHSRGFYALFVAVAVVLAVMGDFFQEFSCQFQ